MNLSIVSMLSVLALIGISVYFDQNAFAQQNYSITTNTMASNYTKMFPKIRNSKHV